MAASDGQLVFDCEVDSVAETATGSGVWAITLQPTAGVDSSRPGGLLAIDATAGIVLNITATVAPPEFASGRRVVVGVDLLT